MLNTAQRKELIGLQRLIYASVIGSTAAMTVTMIYSLGAFIPHLQAEFGWSRGDISLAATFLTLAMFITGTTVGRLADRYGAARVGAFSLLAYAAGVVILANNMSQLYHLWIGYFLVAVLGVGSSPIALVRPITTEFQAARGVALGIALTGAGIAGFWVPRLVTQVSVSYGWREAYMALAGIAVLASPVVLWGFRRLTPLPSAITTEQNVADGMDHRAARRSASYWLLSLTAFAMGAGIAGVVVHLVPMFMDLGATPVAAAKIASMAGVATVLGRLVVGYLLDRLPCVPLTIGVLLMASCGIVILWGFGLPGSYVAVITLGLVAGAEIDLLAYLTISFFGRRHYGAIYGWQYSVFALGFGSSPYLVGKLYDVTGGYSTPLLCCGAVMVAAALSCAGLRNKRAEYVCANV